MTIIEIMKLFKGYTSSGISKLSRDGYKILAEEPNIYEQIEALKNKETA